MSYSASALSENLIRIAFQSLQLVVTDFLPIMPSSCLQVCVDVAGRFGLQEQELNISLTAIGLMVSASFIVSCHNYYNMFSRHSWYYNVHILL